MTRASLFAFALLSAATMTASVARADDGAAATELFNAGRDLMKLGDYGAACPKLEESVRLNATVGALAKLAECDEHEHRLVRARAHWLQALNLARSTSDPRTAEVDAELARVDRIVPKLRLSAAALPHDAAIRVDDLRVGAAIIGVPFAVEPGPHVITVSAPGRQTWSMTVDALPDGATTAIELPVLADAAVVEPPVVEPPVAAPLPAPSSGSTKRTAAVALAGVGVVGLGLGAYFGVTALGHRVDSDRGCPGGHCTLQGVADNDAAKAAADRATIAFGVSLAFVGVATYFWFSGSSQTPARAIAVAPLVAPGAGGVAMGGRF